MALMRATGRAVLAPVVIVAAVAIGPFAAEPAKAQVPNADVALAVRFAPHYAFRSDYGSTCREGEKFLPVAVEDVLRRDDVAVVNEYGQHRDAPGADGPWPENPRAYIDLPGGTFDGACSYSRWFEPFRDPGDTTVYARIALERGYEGRLALQYWTFWPYNDWNGKHEGDWELVQLTFDASNPDEALEQMPETVTFAQHSGFETRDWGDGIDVTGERHVVVHSAIGSHAAYFGPGRWFANSPATGLACDDTRDPSLRLEPRVVVLGAEPGHEWLKFPGRWGEPHAAFNNGPRGPAFQEPWAKPISWLEGDRSQPSVRIPAAGSLPVNMLCSVAGVASVGYNIGLENPAWFVLAGVLLALALGALLVNRGLANPFQSGVMALRDTSIAAILAALGASAVTVEVLARLTVAGDVLGAESPWVALYSVAIGVPAFAPAGFIFARRVVNRAAVRGESPNNRAAWACAVAILIGTAAVASVGATTPVSTFGALITFAVFFAVADLLVVACLKPAVRPVDDSSSTDPNSSDS